MPVVLLMTKAVRRWPVLHARRFLSDELQTAARTVSVANRAFEL